MYVCMYVTLFNLPYLRDELNMLSITNKYRCQIKTTPDIGKERLY